jgi:hypothetical protein
LKFNNVDGLEPSEGMLEIAKKKNAYKNYFLEGIDAVKPTTLPEGLDKFHSP